MSQRWKLLILCHLLTGTSEGLHSGVLNNFVDKTNSFLQNGPETVDNPSTGFSWQWNSSVRAPLKFSGKRKIEENEVVDLASLENPFRVKISKTVIRVIQAERTADGRSINLRFLVTANVTAALPLICRRANLEVSLYLLTRIRLVPVPQSSLFTVAVGEFTVDPDTITISLLDRTNAMLKRSMGSMIRVLKKSIFVLLQKQNQIHARIKRFLDGLQKSSLEGIHAQLQHTADLYLSI
ncbi:BPI fold-containing family A member 2 [Octodon degus]|uniref:BPI fold-containing family A member 2 n=1 Tax=Octodon degus TaxID=10160 RepID=A0A6P6EE03_OCTDE|nr:BPI fold-containing family A member 2 [Octodon degus]